MLISLWICHAVGNEGVNQFVIGLDAPVSCTNDPAFVISATNYWQLHQYVNEAFKTPFGK